MNYLSKSPSPAGSTFDGMGSLRATVGEGRRPGAHFLQ